MENEIEKSRIEKINKLISEIKISLKMNVEKAINVGELLTEQKGEMGHGKWLNWAKKNLDISLSTAENWMKMYRYKSQLKIVNVTNLRTGLDDTFPYSFLSGGGLSEAYRQVKVIEGKIKNREEEEFREKVDKTIEELSSPLSENRKLIDRRRPHYQPEGWNKTLEIIYQKEKKEERERPYNERQQQYAEKENKWEEQNRAMITTFTGFFGTIPERTKDSDVIWIMETVRRNLNKIKDIKIKRKTVEAVIGFLQEYIDLCDIEYKRQERDKVIPYPK